MRASSLCVELRKIVFTHRYAPITPLVRPCAQHIHTHAHTHIQANQTRSNKQASRQANKHIHMHTHTHAHTHTFSPAARRVCDRHSAPEHGRGRRHRQDLVQGRCVCVCVCVSLCVCVCVPMCACVRPLQCSAHSLHTMGHTACWSPCQRCLWPIEHQHTTSAHRQGVA